MKKTTRLIALLLLLSLTVALLTACAPSEEEISGVWECSYEYNGNDFDAAIAIDGDEYAEVIYKNGELSSTETGDVEIKGNKVNLYDDSASVHHGICTTYKYQGGKLVNNGHKFTKQ